MAFFFLIGSGGECMGGAERGDGDDDDDDDDGR